MNKIDFVLLTSPMCVHAVCTDISAPPFTMPAASLSAWYVIRAALVLVLDRWVGVGTCVCLS